MRANKRASRCERCGKPLVPRTRGKTVKGKLLCSKCATWERRLE